MNPLDWLDFEVIGNSLLTWAIGAGTFMLVWLALEVVRRLIVGRLRAAIQADSGTALKVAEHIAAQTRQWFLFIVALFAGSRIPVWPPSVETVLMRVAVLSLLLQMGIWAVAALTKIVERRRQHELEDDPGAVAAVDMLGFMGRIAIWSLVLLLALDNLGVNITALVAGLGVGGIAVALAAQNILGDLFASLSIVLDKPFVVGDFIIIDDYLGSVERVGIKTTRVRSLSGEQLIFSNNDLLSGRIRNYGRMFERRVVFSIGVTYQTPVEHLRRIPEIIREAIESQDRTRFDRAHFQKHGDFALIFEAVYYVLSPEYNLYMDTQQAINLFIHEQFAREGIEFAYPTQTVFLAGRDDLRAEGD
ncbi:MAG: mechanosensitive ion channel family protein [Gammaproteobacteria bacterium]